MSKKRVFKRRPDSHKGDYGHVFVLAGSVGLTGAAYLTAQAALLSGSGLVTLGISKSLNKIMAKKLTEVMTKPLPETKKQSLSRKAFSEIEKFSKKTGVLAVGPGLSQNKETQALIRKVVSSINRPMVIDADGLNALVGHLELLKSTVHSPSREIRRISGTQSPKFQRNFRGQSTVVTPHPGEMARLIAKTVGFIQKNRKKVARDFARKYNVTLVLKGYRTIVANPEGKIYVNRSGNAGMASGGTGDVLTGMIASFLGQGLSAFEAARYGVYVHGLAGDLAVKEKGQLSLIATDLLNKLPKVLRRCSSEVEQRFLSRKTLV